MKYLSILVVLTLSCSGTVEDSYVIGDSDTSFSDTLLVEQEEVIKNTVSKIILDFSESNEREFNRVESQNLAFPLFNTDSIAQLANTESNFFVIKTQKKKFEYKNINPIEDDSYYDEDIVQYYNVGYNEDLNKHLVYASYYEYGEYFLIDDSTANIDTLNGFPYFSPDSKNLICSFINPYMETEINGEFPSYVSEQEFYSNSGTSFEIITRKSFDYIPLEIRWKDSSTIIIKGISSREYESIMLSNELKLPDNNNLVYKKVEYLIAKSE